MVAVKRCRVWVFVLLGVFSSAVYANTAPVLSAIDLLGSTEIGRSFRIEHAALLSASDAFDGEGDPIQFVIESVTTGELRKDGTLVVAGTTTLGANEFLTWTPALSATAGDIAAFTVKAHDGLVSSTNAVAVRIHVTDRIEGKLLKLTSPDATIGSKLGSVIAAEGDWAIVGAPGDSGFGTGSGAAYLYKWDGRIWSEYQKISSIDVAIGDHFGQSVAISATRVVIGAYGDDGPGTETGAAYVFELQPNGRWQQTAKLTPSDQDADGQYGFSVALAGDYLAVLSPQSPNLGFIYEIANGQWNEVDMLVEASGSGGGVITSSTTLSMAGNRLAVGAPLNTVGGTSAGAVYIFTRDISTSNWSLVAPVQINGNANEQFGSSVSLSGGRLVVGAPGTDVAYVYDWLNSLWSQSASLPAAGVVTAGDGFGSSVSVSGDALIVGAPSTSTNAGAAYAYQFETTTWTLKQTYNTAGISGDLVGQSVAVSAGNILIGASGTTSHTGVLYRDSLSIASSTITYPAEILTEAPVAGKQFGYAVDISSDWMVVGASRQWSDPVIGGAAYVYKWNPTANAGIGNWGIHTTLTLPADIVDDDYFGCAVAIEGNRLVVGAWGYDGSGSNLPETGAVFTYERTGDVWGPPTILKLPTGVGGEKFGYSVALSGNRLVVGTSGSETVYVYTWDGSAWSNLTQLVAPDGVNGRFGYSVAIAGDRLVIGAFTHEASGGTISWAGAAYVFDWTAASSLWVSRPILQASDPTGFAQMGWSVAVSDQWVVAGARGVASYTGAAYAFKWNDVTSSWDQYKLMATGGITTERLGEAVAVVGNRVAVGAPKTYVAPNPNAGLVVLYDWDGSTWNQTEQPVAIPTTDDKLGWSLAASDRWIVAGGPSRNSNAGGVYTFGQTVAGTGPVSPLLGIASVSHSDVGVTIGGGSTITSGTSVTLTAVPSDGYVFKNWQGEVADLTDLDLTLSSLTFMSSTASRVIVPVFEALPVISFASYASYVSGNGTYTKGSTTTVTVTGSPAGYNFSHWEGQTYGMTSSSTSVTNFTTPSLTFDADQHRVLVPVYTPSVDGTAPTVTVNSLITNNLTPTLTGTVTDNVDQNPAVEVSVDSATPISASVINGVWSLNIAGLAEGSHSVTVTAKDFSNNSAQATGTLMIDRTLPVVTIVTPIETSIQTPTLSGTVSDLNLATVQVSVDSRTPVTAAVSGNAWSMVVSPALLSGTYNVVATAMDTATNSAQATGTLTVTLPTTPPVVTVTPVTTSNSSPQLSGTVDALASVNIAIFDAQGTQIQTTPATVAGTTWLVARNTLNPPLAIGLYDVVATATDEVGNVGTDSTINELSIEMVVTVDAVTTSDSTPALSGRVGDASATVSVVVGTQTVPTTVTGTTWTVADGALTVLADGIYNVVATATDAQGNQSTDSTVNELTIELPASTTSPSLVATWNPALGMQDLQLNGVSVMSGRTTAMWGYVFALGQDTGNNPPLDWNWPGSVLPSGSHFSKDMGEKVVQVKNDSFGNNPYVSTVDSVYNGGNHYRVTHAYTDRYVKIIYDHVISGTDLILTVTIDNSESPYYFQLNSWLELSLNLDAPATINQKMESYYPATNVYSPVTAVSDSTKGIGINFIEHRMRPFWINIDSSTGNNKDLNCWMKNAPVPPRSKSSYKLVIRVAEEPGDWRYLLSPYKQWFNKYFGPVQYNVDFRTNVATFCSSIGIVDAGNPYGFRENMDTAGWSSYLPAKLNGLASHNTGPVIFWGVTGSNPRGENYRPDFDIFPEAVENDWGTLTSFFKNTLNNKRFGFLARPNEIAYQKDIATDALVRFNPWDSGHQGMANRRFKRLRDHGASAFYLDTYGSAVGSYPGSAEATVFYLKQLRRILGPDVQIIPEHGYDALHVYAPIWPRKKTISTNPLVEKHKPYGEYSRWLIPGATEVCRVLNDLSTESAAIWAGGAIPIVNDYQINSTLMGIQNSYVNSDGTSKIRTDCRVPGQQ